MRHFIPALLIGAAAASASAATINTWQVSAAFNDLFGVPNIDGHSVWFANELIPGGGRTYVFSGGFGTLEEIDTDNNGFGDELLLTGRVESVSDPDYAYDLEIALVSSGPGAMSPKKELRDFAYIENGGPVDASTWSYYEVDPQRSALVGDGAATLGDTIPVGPYPEAGSMPFQLGVGANGKNVEFGLSGWFGFLVNDVLYQGDVNINVVPEPASLALLLSGALLAARRRA